MEKAQEEISALVDEAHDAQNGDERPEQEHRLNETPQTLNWFLLASLNEAGDFRWIPHARKSTEMKPRCVEESSTKANALDKQRFKDVDETEKSGKERFPLSKCGVCAK